MIQQHRLGYVTELRQDSIERVLSNFLERLDEGQATGQCARQFIIEHFTWDQIAGRLVKVYQAVLDKKPVPAFSPVERPLEPV
jgi:glycosyltransferase involved in cell wall biosynthesis